MRPQEAAFQKLQPFAEDSLTRGLFFRLARKAPAFSEQRPDISTQRFSDNMKRSVMSRSSVLLFLLSIASAADAPAGATIEIRLKTKVSSNASKAHDPIEAAVIKPVMSGDEFVIPYGAIIRGDIELAQPSAAADKRALLQLTFNQLAGSNGKSIKLDTKVTAVDNARESVDEKGLIQGILASESLSARMDQGLNRLGQRAAGLADFLQLAKNAVLKGPDSEIVYEPGVEMTIQLASKVAIDSDSVPGMSIQLQPIASEQKLQEMVVAQ